MQDYDKIYQFAQEVFKTAQVRDGTEQDFVLKLRQSDNYIPELAMLVEDKGKIISHIMLTKQIIQTPQNTVDVLLLAPLSTAIEYRNQGLGSKLVVSALDKARQMGYKAVVLVGNPQYYGRFGFVSSLQLNITNTQGIPEQYVQLLELFPKSLEEVQSGTLTFME